MQSVRLKYHQLPKWEKFSRLDNVLASDHSTLISLVKKNPLTSEADMAKIRMEKLLKAGANYFVEVGEIALRCVRKEDLRHVAKEIGGGGGGGVSLVIVVATGRCCERKCENDKKENYCSGVWMSQWRRVKEMDERENKKKERKENSREEKNYDKTRKRVELGLHNRGKEEEENVLVGKLEGLMALKGQNYFFGKIRTLPGSILMPRFCFKHKVEHEEERELLEVQCDREADMTTKCIEKLLNAGANVSLTIKGTDDMAPRQYFVEVDAIVVRFVRKEDLHHVAKATGGGGAMSMVIVLGMGWPWRREFKKCMKK
ncbi:hypothetical protein Pfo_024495 [Paulownia fortunei]|nr:hypothetical protein Pfo_024495 [Paulownia fortunei]